MTRSGKTQRSRPSEDFTMVDEAFDLPHRPKPSNDAPRDLAIEVQPLQKSDHFLVSIQTQKRPQPDLKRASCDIVLVIDVSGSMEEAAPQPDIDDPNEKEAAGLSVLDLTKHGARTIVQALNEGDRLGIVTFATNAEIIHELLPMTPFQKQAVLHDIEAIGVKGATNLWAGIRTGLELFEKTAHIGNYQGLFVLTDGMPNHMCPKQGYVAKLSPMLASLGQKRPTVPTIHTFGFGYGIKSALLQSIAEVGNGIYSFIPDVGMIGTVFVHAVANLFTTFATSCTIEVITPANIELKALGLKDFVILAEGKEGGHHYALRLGNIQYGQSRDLVFTHPGGFPEDMPVDVMLKYKLSDGSDRTCQVTTLLPAFTATTLGANVSYYHLLRSELCEFLYTLFPLKDNGEHTYITITDALSEAMALLDVLVAAINCALSSGQTRAHREDPHINSILKDLAGEDPNGQISKALLSDRKHPYWTKWGHHYLPSLLHAHQRQLCNTFKDPGPLMYGADSPLFIKCRDELDSAFDNLPAPTGSRPKRVVPTYDRSGTRTGSRMLSHSAVRTMSSYNSPEAPCFEGESSVKMADGHDVKVKAVKAGMWVWTPSGSRMVMAVVKTRVRHGKMCHIGDLRVTQWHPIKHDGRWVFPNDAAERVVPFAGDVYSVLLPPSDNPDSHAIEVGGHVCVTLGHGVVQDDGGDENDVRAHAFFGDYGRVALSLARLKMDKKGHLLCGGLKRDAGKDKCKGKDIEMATGRKVESQV
ncbi:hypothetical protein LTR98_002556 [Exophiala xenobiotica]|nr:hypothetical protein LTR98_002556 [Exophiala xenobiotica]